ncbi:hypothetical protein DZB54_23295 [Herbaspirillum sp. 3R-3a1]|nr:hypothetical protein DZB54_23295 [Herbaspirillum sp. 3R-3a1]
MAREIQSHGERPIRFVFQTLLLFSLYVSFSLFLPDSWLSAAGVTLQLKEDADYLTYFTALWSIQATLAALVYPFVISFVTVFLQRRPAAEAFVHIYILDSGGLVAGLSSITLVIVMAIQYALIPRYGTTLIKHTAILDAVWFFVNAILTLYFLYRTVEFLRPVVQMQGVKRYLLGVALPREIARIAIPHVLEQAPSNGWLPIPVPDFENLNQETEPRIWISRYSYRKGDVQGHLLLKRPSKLVDVRLWPLRVVTTCWLSRARAWPETKSEFGGARSSRKPMLSISLSPETTYDGQIPLAIVADGPNLPRWQRCLLRLAFVFRSDLGERNSISPRAIIQELEIDVCSAISNQNDQIFRKSYETLLQVHELLLDACLSRNDDGTFGSLAMLPEKGHWMEQGLYVGWTEAYRSIFQAAVENLDKDTNPLKRICYFVQHIASDAVLKSPIEIRENILMMPTYLMFLIGGWWVKRIEEQGFVSHSAHHSQTLQAPAHRAYEDIFVSFVGAWENARKSIGGIPDQDEQFKWSEARVLVQLNTLHIRETARMLLASIERGDRIAAEWFADVLSKWWGNFSYERTSFSLHQSAIFITVEDISLEWDFLNTELSLEIREGTEHLQRSVLLAALHNYLQDIRLITVEILLQWCSQSKSPSFDNSLAMGIVADMVQGKQWRNGGTQSAPLNRLTAAGYLLAKTRQHIGGMDERRIYEARLNDFVEKIRDMERPGMTGSRVYSYSGPNSLDSLDESQIILMMILSDASWSEDDPFCRQLANWSKPRHIERGDLDKARDVFNSWLNRLSDPQPIMPSVIDELANRIGKEVDEEIRRSRVSEALSTLKQSIETRRRELLAAATIDPDKLKQAALNASTEAFNKMANRFPLCLFRNVNFSNEEQEKYTLRLNGLRKGEFTTVAFDPPAINGDDYLANVVAQAVDGVLLTDVLSRCELREIVATDSDSYWKELKAEAARISNLGLSPILLLDNATQPDWIWDWQYALTEGQHPRPEDLIVHQHNGQSAHYQCHLNNIAVYVGPLTPPASLIVPREVFDSVTFRRFATDRYVEANVEVLDADPSTVALLLKFERSVQVSAAIGAKIRYSDVPLQNNA